MIRVLILAVLLLPASALAQALSYADRSGTITAGGTAQVAIPAWSGRHGCMIRTNRRAACGYRRRRRRLPDRPRS